MQSRLTFVVTSIFVSMLGHLRARVMRTVPRTQQESHSALYGLLLSRNRRIAEFMLGAAVISVAVSGNAYAQGTPSCYFGGGVGYVDANGNKAPAGIYSMLKNNMHVVGGSMLPWYGRTGNGPVTVFGYVKLAGGYTYSPMPYNPANVTVTFNGSQCTMIPIPGSMDTVNWRYDGPVVTVPNQAMDWNLTISAYYSGTQMRLANNQSQIASYTYSCKVYIVLSALSKNLPGVSDKINLSPTCFLQDNGNGIHTICPCSYAPTIDQPGGVPARLIKDYAWIVPPASAAMAGLFDISGITIGIIQSGVNYAGGITWGTRPDNSRFSYDMTSPFALMWDGDISYACYYSSDAWTATPGQPVDISWTSKPLTVIDYPGVTINNAVGMWDCLNGISSTFYTMDFEDVLSASSADFPGIVVPIYGYHNWHVNLLGAAFNGIWQGGCLTSDGHNTQNGGVTDISHGPMNSYCRGILH
jgi:hypothetical protein